ncbi:MAG TPA: PAS domain S-box protein [Daejeonella sp.]|nr:PAS domain S-box protein [Daejeonella sp.]
MTQDKISVESHLQELYSYQILDTSPEKEYDAISRLATYVCKTPVAFINFIDKDRIWTKSKIGIGLNEVAHVSALSSFVAQNMEVLELDLASNQTHPGIAEIFQQFHYRFFAGVPLITNKGFIIGTLCVADSLQRQLDEEQKEALTLLAAEIVSHLEMRKKSQEIEETYLKYEDIYNMFDASAELHCVMDRQSNIRMVNRSIEKLLGYTVEECVGRPIWHFLFEEDLHRLLPLMEEGIRSRKKYFEFETRIRSKGDEIKWVGWSIAVHKGKWYANGRDITQQKEMLAELEQLSLAASKVENGVIISNSNNEVVWVNDAFEHITGYNISDLEGHKLGDILKGKDTDINVIEQAREFTRNKKSFSVDLLAYRKDGTPVWLSIINSVVLDAQGEIDKEIEVIIDITARKKAEQELETLSLVASKTINGVAISDSEGCVNWVNNAFEQLTGYSLDELKGKRPGDLLTGEETNVEDLEKARALTNDLKSSSIELLCYKKDGSPIWLSISNTPTLNASGEIERQVEIINDISERKLAELELIKTREEALALSNAKETFLSVMSHEIRTPLHAVIGITHLLMDDNPTESQSENLKILSFSAQKLLALINDILDFTKIETGNMVLEKANVNLIDLVSQTLNSLHFKTAEIGVELKSEIDHLIPAQVKGDNIRLYQILVNLLGNSLKFTQQGEVKLKLDLVAETPKSVKIRFEVSDTGIGIPEDKIDYIFETYTQATTDITRKFGGTGLGLAITKRLLELHNSSIQVVSELGKGSTFSFEIEFEKVEELAGLPSDSTAKVTLGSTVLVVDDNEINRFLARKVLSKWGIGVDLAENGEDALVKVQQKPYDLILMDLHMPVMGGLEASKAIRNLQGDFYRDIPIIALTASIMAQELDCIADSGMNDYVMKPFVPAELHRKIQQYLKKSRSSVEV